MKRVSWPLAKPGKKGRVSKYFSIEQYCNFLSFSSVSISLRQPILFHPNKYTNKNQQMSFIGFTKLAQEQQILKFAQ
jgi:hypothetical protein